jgi:phage terminase large subunit-like protein
MQAVLNKPKVAKTWRKLLCSLSGYDPFAQAGDCWFDAEAAQYYIDFIEQCCTHIEGALAGKPFLMEAWEKAIVGNLFGWYRLDFLNRTVRRYRKAFIYVARKNGKSPLSAAIHNAVFFLDNEAGQINNIAAASRDQATKLYRHISGMIRAEPEMDSRCHIYQTTRSITKPDNSVTKVIPGDDNTAHGDNQHLGMVDELHAQPDRKLVDAMVTAMASANRIQPLMIFTTTADFDRPSICNEEYDYACKVRDGVIDDPSYLPVIYEAQPTDDWTDEKTWYKANPNLGVSVSLDYLRDECKRAQEIPAYENTFKRLHLNLRTEQDVRWLTLDVWDACGTGPYEPAGVPETVLKGQACYAGFDLSSNTDVAGYVLLFPPLKGGYWWVVPRLFIPKDNAIKRERRDKVPYFAWAKDGYITMTPGNVVDYSIIKAKFEQDRKDFNIREAAFDRWNFEALRQQFIAEGMSNEFFVAFGQGFASMSAPTKELEKLLLARELSHGGHPVLRWMASNVAVESDAAGNVKPSKKRSPEKIDGIVMLIMALGRALVSAGPKVSIYESRGLRVLGER